MSEERYDILKLLGKGRTGGVYEAEDTRLSRKVAMRRFFSENSQTDVSEYAEEFKKTWQSLSALQHPNLLRVFDAGMDDDGEFIISQLLKGDTLHNRLKEGPLSNWDVWDLGHQMLDAFSTAHAGGFVHGALTPGSILMSPRARGGYLYVILDMGLSRLAPLIQGKDSVLSMMADPAILAPELFDNSEATEKSDLYMLGNILFMCLAGGHPFAAKSIDECAELHKQGLPDLAEFAPDAPRDFLDWIAELYHVDPALRPESVVVALKSLPKVEKPAKVRVTPINTSVGVGAPADTQRTSAPVTAVPSGYGATTGMMTTGPLTAGGALAQTSQAQLLNKYKAPEKSYKGLIITIAALAILGGVLFYIMSSSGEKTGEEIAKEKAKKEQKDVGKANDKNVASQEPVKNLFPLDEIFSYKVVNGKEMSANWYKHYGAKTRVTAGGVVLEGTKGVNPGISTELTNTDIENMFKRGWTIKYVVKPIVAEHQVGFLISVDENDFWENKNKPVGVLLRIVKDGQKIVISSKGGNKKVDVVDKDNSFLTIELRGKASDYSGKYQMYLNGELIVDFIGNLIRDPISTGGYANRFFSFSGNSNLDKNKWAFIELTLSTGAPDEE